MAIAAGYRWVRYAARSALPMRICERCHSENVEWRAKIPIARFPVGAWSTAGKLRENKIADYQIDFCGRCYTQLARADVSASAAGAVLVVPLLWFVDPDSLGLATAASAALLAVSVLIVPRTPRTRDSIAKSLYSSAEETLSVKHDVPRSELRGIWIDASIEKSPAA